MTNHDFQGEKKRTRETEQPVLVKIALNNPKIALNNIKKSIKNESAFGLQGDPGVKIRTFSPKFELLRQNSDWKSRIFSPNLKLTSNEL